MFLLLLYCTVNHLRTDGNRLDVCDFITNYRTLHFSLCSQQYAMYEFTVKKTVDSM